MSDPRTGGVTQKPKKEHEEWREKSERAQATPEFHLPIYYFPFTKYYLLLKEHQERKYGRKNQSQDYGFRKNQESF
jgi:hypothetical protein